MPEPRLEHTELDRELLAQADACGWYVGFSGGVDSSVLLHLLHRWRAANPGAPPLTAIHVNHGMQDAADDWQQHCEEVCKKLQLPLLCHRVSVDQGPAGAEAAAREARYRVFEDALAPGAVLYLAHHLDDQVETFFLRLLRGAGVQGLAAIPASRPLGAGRLVRPLLQVTRSRLEEYAGRHSLRYVQDPSNGDPGLDRGFLRHEVLPLVSGRWPGYRRTVARASEHMADAARTLRAVLPSPDTCYSAMGDPGVAVTELAVADVGAVKLRGWLQSRGLPAPGRAPLEEFLRQLRESGPEARPRLQCSAFALQCHRGCVYLLPEPSAPTGPVTLAPGEVLELPGVGRVTLEPVASRGLVLDESDTLTLGWRQGGERCQPAGSVCRRSLKQLLQEADVPPWWRDRVPLLFLGDQLLAVGDLWLCHSDRYRQRPAGGETLWCLRWERNIGPAFD